MKKILSLTLAIILMFSVVPAGLFNITVSAAFSGTTGDCTWKLEGETLTISGNGAMENYNSSTRPLWSITEVIIENGVTNIGDYAFFRCTSLESITIPESVTSIGDRAFRECTSLASIAIPESITSMGTEVFVHCTSLVNINVDADNKNYSSENGVLFNKDKTQIISYPAGKTETCYTIPESVTNIGDDVFYYCTNLVSITIPDSVTSIGNYAFYRCESLASITIPDSVTSIGSIALGYCISLASINVDANNENYSSLNGVLFNKDKTEIISYPAGKTETCYTIPESVTNIGDDVFYYCTNLVSITIPESVTSIGNYAFYNCTNLENITIPDCVTSIGDYAFFDCTNLENITILDGVTSIGYFAFGGCTSLQSIIIPESVTSIGNCAFHNCTSLENITIPDSVTNIGDYAFFCCTSLASIILPDSITSIGDCAFVYCESLKSITIPDGVTSIGNNAFRNCPSLKTVYYCGTAEQWDNISIDTGNTYLISATRYYHDFSIWQIGNDAICKKYRVCSICGEEEVVSLIKHDFQNGVCTNCTVISEEVLSYTVENGEAIITDCDASISGDVIIPQILGGYPVKSIGDSSFGGRTKLSSITIPDGVASIGKDAFKTCRNLESIVIPSTITSIGSYAFSSCSNLKKVYITDVAKWCAIDFLNSTSNPLNSGAELYLNNKLVEDLVIPDGVENIGKYAFINCGNLISVLIPPSVTSIGTSAFVSCSTLEKVYMTDVAKWCNISFSNAFSNPLSLGAGLYLNNRLVKNLSIPDGVEKIEIGAYFNCTNIESIKIPVSVISIGDSAFYNCINLKTVYYCGEKEQWNNITIDSNNASLTSAELICHSEHIFNDWVIIKEPTCTENGEKYRVCSICGEEEKQVLSALGHNYSNEFTVDKQATDFEDGIKSKHCLNCDEVADVTVIPKTSIASGNCGDNAKWAVKDDGTLLIAGSGATDNYKLPSYAPWYTYSSTITKIIIEEAITKIGNNSFGYFESLENVLIENPDLSFGYYVFPDATDNITVYSKGGGSVENYCKDNNIKCIKPNNPEIPSKPVLKYCGANYIELEFVEGYEYSIDGVNWQKSNVFKNLVSGERNAFYQRIADGVYNPSASSEALYVTTLSKVSAPIISGVLNNTVTLQYVNGYEYSIDGVNWQESNVFTNVGYDTILSFYQRKKADSLYGETPASDAAKCIFASAPKVLVGFNSIKVIPKDNYEYCIDDMVWQDSNIFTKFIVPEETYTVYQRPKAQEGIEIFYDTEGTTIVIDGENSIENPDSTHLVWLKKMLLTKDNGLSLAADLNGDSKVDILDLVRLKKMLMDDDITSGPSVDKISQLTWGTIDEINNGYVYTFLDFKNNFFGNMGYSAESENSLVSFKFNDIIYNVNWSVAAAFPDSAHDYDIKNCIGYEDEEYLLFYPYIKGFSDTEYIKFQRLNDTELKVVENTATGEFYNYTVGKILKLVSIEII